MADIVDKFVDVNRYAACLVDAATATARGSLDVSATQEEVDENAVSLALSAVLTRAREEVGINDAALDVALSEATEFLEALRSGGRA